MKHLDPRAEALIRSAIGSISGVTVANAATVTTKLMGQSRLDIDLDVRGWSPSLHAHIMRWKTKCRVGVDHESAAQDALYDLVIEMDQQRRRLARGLQIGTASPLAICGMATRVGHIRIDRGLAALVAERARTHQHDRPFRSVVASAIIELHDSIGSGRSNQIDTDDTLIDDVWQTMESVAHRTTYDGCELWMAGVLLPQSIAMTAPGRRLGDIVAVPAAIADHIIEAVEEAGDEGGTQIRVTPRLATLNDIEREMA